MLTLGEIEIEVAGKKVRVMKNGPNQSQCNEGKTRANQLVCVAPQQREDFLFPAYLTPKFPVSQRNGKKFEISN